MFFGCILSCMDQYAFAKYMTFFAGFPQELGVNEMGVDSVIESTLHVVPNQIAGWANAST